MDGFYAGASTLAEQLDKPVLAILRDGRHIVGRLISYDHFGTLVLQSARERHVVSSPRGGGAGAPLALLADVPAAGLYVVRGENLTLLAEIDEAVDAANPLLARADQEEVLRLEAETVSEAAVLGRRLRACASSGVLATPPSSFPASRAGCDGRGCGAARAGRPGAFPRRVPAARRCGNSTSAVEHGRMSRNVERGWSRAVRACAVRACAARACACACCRRGRPNMPNRRGAKDVGVYRRQSAGERPREDENTQNEGARCAPRRLSPQ
jgi:small nuclear ribonucleoprotein (snRNP)-like protein